MIKTLIQKVSDIRNFITNKNYFLTKTSFNKIIEQLKKNKTFQFSIVSILLITAILILIVNGNLSGAGLGKSLDFESHEFESSIASSSVESILSSSENSNESLYMSSETKIPQNSSYSVPKTGTQNKSKYGDVSVPANFTSAKINTPEGFINVPASQQMIWMQSLSLFPQSQNCTMLIWTDKNEVSCVVKNDLIVANPIGFSNNNNITNAAIIIALNKVDGNSQTEILQCDLTKNGNEWVISPKKNIKKANFPITQQLRVVSPRSPLTRLEVDDTSKLTTFDPGNFGAVGKSPFRLRDVTIASVKALFGQAREDGVADITIRDTYRGYEQQNSMFVAKMNYYKRTGLNSEMAFIKAEKETAFPGTSEHHDGFTTDVITKNVNMNKYFGSTAFGKWLSANCWDYGFIIRYLAGKESQTTKIYEPWHIRYVGTPTALLFKKYGIVLEEFHSYLTQNQYLTWSCMDSKQGIVESKSDYIYIQCTDPDDLILPIDMAITPSSSYTPLLSGSDNNSSANGEGSSFNNSNSFSDASNSNTESTESASPNTIIPDAMPLSYPSAILSEDGGGHIVVILKLG